MPIDEKNLNIIAKKLENKIKIKKCESCGKEEWIISGFYFPISLSDEINKIFFGSKAKIAPMIMLFCNNCGYTRFYNLSILEIADELVKNKQKNMGEEE